MHFTNRHSLLLCATIWLCLWTTTSQSQDTKQTIEFIENKGQWDKVARYAVPICNNGQLFVEDRALTYTLFEPGFFGHLHKHIESDTAETANKAKLIRTHSYRVEFVNSIGGLLEPEMRTKEIRNYIHGNDSSRWARKVSSYQAIKYHSLWPGIAARLYQNNKQQFEYDFEVAAQADAKQIILQYNGVDDLRLTSKGDLEVITSLGKVVELAPIAWQVDALGKRKVVKCRYLLEGKRVKFILGSYDHDRVLTIDPTLSFFSFTGSEASNWGFTATYDDQGNLYSGGIVFSQGYPASLGAYSSSFSGAIDIVIMKFNTSATGPPARAWATYLGGSQAEIPQSMVVTSRGSVFILGVSGSNDFPISSSAYDRTFNGGTPNTPLGYSAPYDMPTGSDLIIARLSADGSQLAAATYLGGSQNDGILNFHSTSPKLVKNYGDIFRSDITIDAADNVYICSNTSSPNFPTANGFNSAYSGGTSDAIVCKLNSSLSALQWSSFLGGNQADAAYSIQVDSTFNVYVCGGTASTNFPVIAGAMQTTHRGDVDGFVARISTSGNILQKSTLLGTNSFDQAYIIQLDKNNDVYVLGNTLGYYPITPGKYNTPNSRQFIQKINNDLSVSLFSTSFGSGRATIDLNPTAFFVDNCNRVFVAGWGGGENVSNSVTNYNNGTTLNLPTTNNALQRNTDGADFYLAQFSAGLTTLEYATFFGVTGGANGDHTDGGTSRFDKNGVLYQGMCSCGSNAAFPSLPGTKSYSLRTGITSAGCNNAAFRFDFEASKSTITVGPDIFVCSTAAPVPLNALPAGGIWSGPGVSGAIATGYVFTPSPALIGTQILTYTVSPAGSCAEQAQMRVTVTTPSAAVSFSMPQTTFCKSTTPLPSVALLAQPAGGTFSGPGVIGNFFNPGGLGIGTYTLAYTYAPSNSGCVTRVTQQVTIQNSPVATAGADTLICFGSTKPFQLRGMPVGGVWSGSLYVSSTGIFQPPSGFAGPVQLTYVVSNGSCSGSATKRVGVFPAPAISGTWAPVRCPADAEAPLEAGFTAAGAPAGATFQWEFGDGATGTGSAPTHTYTAPGRYQPRLTVRYNNNQCSASALLAPVEVEPRFAVPNIITPNGDRQNETFVVTHGCPPRLQVFSRWGNQVYEAAAYANDWAGDGVAAGLYYYLLRFPDGRTQKGWLEIVR